MRRDPESKGVVERANGFLETSFLPGRTFASPAVFNAQLVDWLPVANRRTVRALRGGPVDLLERDLAGMLPLTSSSRSRSGTSSLPVVVLEVGADLYGNRSWNPTVRLATAESPATPTT